MRNCGWTNGFIARYNLIVEIPRQTQTKQGENKTEGGGGMLTYEQQTEKLLSKRQAVLDRIESDKAEIEKINAKLNAIPREEQGKQKISKQRKASLRGNIHF